MKKIFMKVTMHFLTGSVVWPAVREINLGPCAHLHHQQLAFLFICIFDLLFLLQILTCFFLWNLTGLCAHQHHQLLTLIEMISFALVVFTIFLPFGNIGLQSKKYQLYKVDCPFDLYFAKRIYLLWAFQAIFEFPLKFQKSTLSQLVFVSNFKKS